MGGSILLGEVAEHLTTLEIACNRCDRRGRVSMERLMAVHGPAMWMTSFAGAAIGGLSQAPGDEVPRHMRRAFPAVAEHLHD
jgi:hypothetical protein